MAESLAAFQATRDLYTQVNRDFECNGFSRACWLDSAPPTLLERGSRHCHGINNTQSPSMSVIGILQRCTSVLYPVLLYPAYSPDRGARSLSTAGFTFRYVGVQLPRLIAFALFCLVCVLGTSFRSDAQSTALPMGSHPIEPTDWSFQCFPGGDCGTNGSWITTTSQPGTVRLSNSGTSWSDLNTAAGTYDWKNLDTWLDLIAQHQPRAVIYTFNHIPCWISTAACDHKGWGNGHSYAAGPPRDLTSSGSRTFDAFVTALVQHCSPAGNCVTDYIKYWEIWNEPDLTENWTGTETQLYSMFAPVIPIIRNNVRKAIVSTPAVCGGHTSWITSWMTLENTNGRLSDYYGFHVYLKEYTPEVRMGMVQYMLDTKSANGWTTTPWMNTETGYDPFTFTCSTQYTAEDCRGQLVRWHVLQYAYQGGGGGAFHVGSFNWDSISVGGYDTYYYTMMQWLTGATFTASCTNSGNVWTCPLKEASGATALIVWDAVGDSQYTPASEYVDYRKFNGTYGGETIPISPRESVPIAYVPVMLETAIP
jgi:hypothetical protein